jgi:hypothetical protein
MLQRSNTYLQNGNKLEFFTNEKLSKGLCGSRSIRKTKRSGQFVKGSK